MQQNSSNTQNNKIPLQNRSNDTLEMRGRGDRNVTINIQNSSLEEGEGNPYHQNQKDPLQAQISHAHFNKYENSNSVQQNSSSVGPYRDVPQGSQPYSNMSNNPNSNLQQTHHGVQGQGQGHGHATSPSSYHKPYQAQNIAQNLAQNMNQNINLNNFAHQSSTSHTSNGEAVAQVPHIVSSNAQNPELSHQNYNSRTNQNINYTNTNSDNEYFAEDRQHISNMMLMQSRMNPNEQNKPYTQYTDS